MITALAIDSTITQISEGGKKKITSGRPRIQFDLAEVRKAALCQPTIRELAASLGHSYHTVRTRLVEDEAFKEAYEAGKANGKKQIRQKQYDLALKGNVTMLIWWGKQNLDQTEIVKQRLTGASDKDPVAVRNFSDLAKLALSTPSTKKK